MTPAIGVVGGVALERLYGVPLVDPNLELLLRHRAVLFGILGTAFAFAAFRREWHSVALAVALLSTLSFVVIAWMSPAANPQIERVAMVDLALAVGLVVALVIRMRSKVGHGSDG